MEKANRESQVSSIIIHRNIVYFIMVKWIVGLIFILQAEAIRKILGQDSNRKKREDKARKRRDEIAQVSCNCRLFFYGILGVLKLSLTLNSLVQEKAAYAATFAANTVRWVMGPAGTVVTFPEEMGLPSIFSSKPCRFIISFLCSCLTFLDSI